MSKVEGLELVIDFFEDVKKKEQVVNAFTEMHELTMYDFQLLAIIYQHKEILLRQIIKEKLIKKNQVNKAVKHLYEAELINKLRLPMDERTVQLSIREDKKVQVEQMIHDFGHEITKIYI